MKFRRLLQAFYRAVEDDHFRYARYLNWRGVAKVGKNTSINTAAWFMDWGRVTIGDDCSISRVEFITHSGGDRITQLRTGRSLKTHFRIVVGDRTTIGSGVQIIGDVRIGSDCMVYAGARVTKDVPDGSVVGGDYARVLGSIDDFDERQVARHGIA